MKIAKEKKEKNKKAGNKQGIQFQIQSKIGASIIVVRAVIAVLVVVVVYNLLIKANNTELQQDSEAISLQVEKYFLPFERMVKQLALDEDVQTILTTTKAGQRMMYTRRNKSSLSQWQDLTRKIFRVYSRQIWTVMHPLHQQAVFPAMIMTVRPAHGTALYADRRNYAD